MARSRLMHLILCCLVVAAGVAGCSTDTTTSGESTGSLDLSLELAPGVVINEVKWVISRPLMEDMMGTIDTSAPGATASVEVFGLPPGDGYTVTLTAMVEGEDTPCIGSADFSVVVGISTPVMVMLNCKRPERLGGVRVNGKFNVCAELKKVIVSPLQTSVGNQIDLSALGVDVDDDPEDIQYLWSASTGIIADPGMRVTTYTCTEVIDEETITIRISDDWDFCMDEWDVEVKCVEGDGGNLCDDVPACIPDGNECTETECNPLTGECETSDLDGEDCDGGNGMCVGDECVPKNLCIGKPPCDDTDCTEGVCVPATGNCVDQPVNEGQDCDNATGICMEGACIPKEPCGGEECPDTGNDCTVSMCNISSDQCEEMNVPNDTDCLVDDVAGKCSNGTCIVGNLCIPDPCGAIEQCVQDGTCDPADGSCTPGGNEPEGTDCSIGGIVCDGNGNCVDCNVADDCPGVVGQCSVKTCIGNSCGTANGNEGEPCDLVGIGDGQCMAGECVEPPECDDLNPCPDDNNDCTTVACIAGTCVSGDVDAGDPCADGVCDGQGLCVECINITDCPDDGNQCTARTCETNMCGQSNLPEDTLCDIDGIGEGFCDGGGTCVECNNDGQCPGPQACVDNTCMASAIDPCQDTPAEDCTKEITVSCGNNVTADVSILPYQLTVDPTPIAANQSFTADLGGVAVFSEVFLDAAQGAVPGGVTKANLVDLIATVQTRGSGATGPNVPVGGGSAIPYECVLGDTGPGAQQPCDPINDQASVPGTRGNTDCIPTGFFNPCGRMVVVPTSSDCAPAGICDMLGKASQCAANNFCVTGGLDLDLDPSLGNPYTAGDSGSVALFGWFDDPADDSPGVGTPPVDGDGTWNMVQPTYTGFAGPVGLAVNAGGLAVQLECVLGVDAGGPDGPMPPVPDDGSPSPDSALLSFPVP